MKVLEWFLIMKVSDHEGTRMVSDHEGARMVSDQESTRMVSDHEGTRMVSDHEGTRKRFDHALFMAKTWCPCGPDVLVNISVFYADLRLEPVGKQWYTCLQHHKRNGTWDHQNCIIIKPRS